MTVFRKLSISRFFVAKRLCILIIFGLCVMAYFISSSKVSKNEKVLTRSKKFEVWPEERMTNISKAVQKISSEHSFVMVTLINEAYIPFALSWLCNTKHMNIHQHVLFLTTDKETDDMLKKHWPDVKSVILKGIDSKRNETHHQAGYIKLMTKRTEALMQILKENVAIFLFEVDCLWLRNPVELLLSYENVDIISAKVSNRPSSVAGGFIYLFPTKSTKILWEELTRRMLVLYDKIKSMPPWEVVTEGNNDQQYLSALIINKYRGIKVKMLDAKEFPDRQWYNLTESKRQISKPYIINNNWITGNSGKIKRAKEWKHWFIKEDNTCDVDNLSVLKHQQYQRH